MMPTVPNPQSGTRQRVAVVTGASSGIGRAIALELGRRGFRVAIHAARSKAELDGVANELERLGARGPVVLSDFLVESARERLVTAIYDSTPVVDAWVNNAGADVLTGPRADLPLAAKLDLLWKVDVLGTLMLSREVGRRMSEEHRRTRGEPAAPLPAIINIGWDQAWQGMEGDSGQIFAVAKGAIMAATASLAQSLAPDVRVNCVAPGWIQTDWGATASRQWQERARRQSLLGRWGQPEDVARAVAMLASDEAAFINGQILYVNGGFNFFPR